MRILSIRFKNLNSLIGEWEIDFTDPAYTSDGIFAITGPTGAGKTTLLDAICLALYGRTPRLDRVNKSINDVMTRHTGECFAEVTFSTQNGRYRCHWAQHKAHKKAAGELQPPRHEISKAGSGEIIDNQIRTVADRIVAVTGMDFERFTQSMMLAQGGFAAFLKASADERAPILEQITGTEIYSDISRHVHLRATEVRNALQMLEAELKGMSLLSLEQEAQLLDDEKKLAAQLTRQQGEETSARIRHDWKKLCLDLQLKTETLTQDYLGWQEQDNAFAPQRETLARAIKALELGAEHASLTSLRTEQQADQEQLALALNAMPTLQENTAQLHQQRDTAASVLLHREKTLSDMRPIFKQVHSLDLQINQGAEYCQKLSAELSGKRSEQKELQHTLDSLRNTITNKTEQLVQHYPSSQGDTGLIIELAEEQLTQTNDETSKLRAKLTEQLQEKSIQWWRKQKEVVNRKHMQLKTLGERTAQKQVLAHRLEALNLSIQDSQQQLENLSVEIEGASALIKAYEKTLAALRQQQIQQQRILSLEEQRRQLIENQPCPLCGSTEHPYAEHDPVCGELDQDIAEAEQQLNTSQIRLGKLSNQQIRLQTQLEHDKILHSRDMENMASLDAGIAELMCAIEMPPSQISAQALKHLDQSLSRELETINTVIAAAETLEDNIRQQEKRESELRQILHDTQTAIKDIEHLSSSVADNNTRLEKLNLDIERLEHSLAASQTALTTVREKRQALLGERNPDHEEIALASALQAAQADLQQQQDALTKSEHQLRDLKQHITSLKQRIQNRNDILTSRTSDFQTQLRAQGFADEDQYLAARLGETERRKIQDQDAELSRSGIELQSAIKQAREDLATQQAKNLSDASLDALQQHLEEQTQKTRQLQETLGGLRQKLRDNDRQRLQQRSLTEKVDQQKLETDRWGRLHALIGSSDGKKFRNFAQGLTFDMMIAHANQQLRKMTDRYLLQRDSQQPLDLNVIDNYQAGEIRSTRNLSGGESFIVSLALALGLSRMASRNVRVDSLFLDEGFGTLDEDALDTALETLTSLQQEGKLIGVISHVPALKERIATQIRVTPVASGRSAISGPGCRALSS